jgi:hypothetical protein
MPGYGQKWFGLWPRAQLAIYELQYVLSFGRGASKSTTQGGIFDLYMYVTFDCAGIAAF